MTNRPAAGPHEGSYRTPAFEHATAGDAMRAGVISCPAETSLRQVAQIMSTEHIHCVVVSNGGGWSVVSDLDLLRAVETDLDQQTADRIAVSDLPTVGVDTPLDRAAQLMAEHDVTHVLVLDQGNPAGVLSTLDIAGTLAWGQA